MPVAPGGGLVEYLAETENVGASRPGTFRRNEPFGAHIAQGIIRRRHEADVRKLRHAVHKDDVGWLDVAMHQARAVQVRQG